MTADAHFTTERFSPQQNGGKAIVRPPGTHVDPRDPATHAHFKSAKEFCDEYTPLSYAVEPLIRSSSLYTLTAKTGAGKTALLIVMALAVATGRGEILGREVAHGRVAYIAAENPDDLRMRIMVTAYRYNVDLADLVDDLVILDGRVPPEELYAKLKSMSETKPFSLVLVDTLAAFFDGKDLNDNVQGGEFMRRVRSLTRLPGLPSVVVAAHPVKNAADDNLVPYGGGAILNEVDGNLTLQKKADGLTSLHWQSKLRGIEFEPCLFRFDEGTCPNVVDVKGRCVRLPVLSPSSEQEAESREKETINREVALLTAMRDAPGGSIRDWADATKIPKSSINRRLEGLAKRKLVETALGNWTLTKAGKKAVQGREKAA